MLRELLTKVVDASQFCLPHACGSSFLVSLGHSSLLLSVVSFVGIWSIVCWRCSFAGEWMVYLQNTIGLDRRYKYVIYWQRLNGFQSYSSPLLPCSQLFIPLLAHLMVISCWCYTAFNHTTLILGKSVFAWYSSLLYYNGHIAAGFIR